MEPKQLAITAVMWFISAGVSAFALVGIRRGHLRVNDGDIKRAARPVAFWLMVTYLFLVAAFMFALPIWKYWR